jgi:hypothetical protein
VQPAAKKKHVFLRPPASELKQKWGFLSNEMDSSRRSPDESIFPATLANVVTHSMPEMGAANALIQRHNNCHSLVQAFLANCFPSQRSPLASRSWITLLGTLPTEVKALELSSAAVAASAIGRKFQDTALVEESHNLYVQGLQELQKALRDRNLVRDDGTLAACMALSLYEAMECPSGGSGAYFSHCEGILALVQARGVEAHSLGAGHQLFLGVRIPGVSVRLVKAKSSLAVEIHKFLLTML